MADTAPMHPAPSFPRSASEFPDKQRTSRSHAGEALADGYNFPGIVLCALALVALAATLTAAGYGFEGWAVISAALAFLFATVGVAWVTLEHRRVKAKEGLHLMDQCGH
ncbi:hypothetical protein ACWEKT_07720 [Nocardia takedensis]|uniref:hypothetical protein n=1 Tax=Nocardia takedensis TaxID=259390 RepID=UPI0002E38424|nr:hypothetical protein [Nocardia takedensis]